LEEENLLFSFIDQDFLDRKRKELGSRIEVVNEKKEIYFKALNENSKIVK
jgi:hypothetical protein